MQPPYHPHFSLPGSHLDWMLLESRAGEDVKHTLCAQQTLARCWPQESLGLYPSAQTQGFGVGLQESIWPEDASLCIHGPSAWPDEPFPEPRSEWNKPDEGTGLTGQSQEELWTRGQEPSINP